MSLESGVWRQICGTSLGTMEGHSSPLALGNAGSLHTMSQGLVCPLPKPERDLPVGDWHDPIQTSYCVHGHQYQRPLLGSHSLGLAASTLGTWPWLRLWHHPTGATGQPWPLACGAALRKRLFICTV